jgi:insulysin|uniref:insulinase family protein n=1 Tax=Cephaloticoccus sp. TaxID=1985742 RepID=UPI00404A8F63
MHLTARLLFTALTFTAPLFARSEQPDLPPRIVAPTDKAEFRHLTLDNGLRVLLVSDPKFNKSAASLVMATGQIDDPFDMVGLAHFTEHMLFLGTEKYPDVASYKAFISQNGGSANAYTTTDHTNYQFEVRHEAFPEALDRFAQFFIAPLFTADFTAREVNAVNNEATRHVQNDSRRVYNVRRELYNPASGESKFSTGNKDTLAKADAAAVRAFYESHYTADRMALAFTGTASLDEQEQLARDIFSGIPKRDLPVVVREPIFLPRKAALRLATVEPVKEWRQLALGFVLPATRQDFVSKPADLLSALFNYPGKGGLLHVLKEAGLVTKVEAGVWERTPNYGSLEMEIDLTPAGEADYQRVLETIFAYIHHLSAAPFPAEFYQEQAKIAALKETYDDRGEGMGMVTQLANQALFYPLEIAERAPFVWGQPDEAAYRRLLNVLTPDNLLVTLAAKGVPTDRIEEIYGTAYAYTERTGASYDALVTPPAVEGFELPGVNPFMPTTTALVAERPLPLIDEVGLQLYYSADIEFQRPQTALIFRFMPRRDVAGLEADLLLQFYKTCLDDAIESAAGEAALAGVTHSISLGLEGFKLTVSGLGDSPARFAQYVADQLLTFDVTPERFAALQEKVLRGLRSYEQTEAYQLARDQANAVLRESFYLPDQHLDRAPKVTWKETRDFAQQYFAHGKIEAVVHGHIIADEAVAATRGFAAAIKAQPVERDALMHREHIVMAPGATVIDTRKIAGANSAIWVDYLLPEETPKLRAAAEVLGKFISEPFYTEMRTRQQLGYIVGSRTSVSLQQHLQFYVIQSSAYSPDELRQRAETYLATTPDQLAELTDEKFATLVSGVRSIFEERPKSIVEKAELMFANGYDYSGDWERKAESLAALDQLTKADVQALLSEVTAPETARRIIVLLACAAHATSEAQPTFTDRETWKAKQSYK